MSHDCKQGLSDLKGKTKKILNGALKHTAAATLAASLVPLGAVGVNQAEAMPASHVDSVITENAGVFTYNYTVFNDSTDPYGGEGEGGEFLLVDWELPFFENPANVIFNIQSPDGWEFEILEGVDDSSEYYNNPNGFYGDYQWDYDPNNDPFAANYDQPAESYVDPPFILHWYTVDVPDSSPDNPIFPLESLDGFSFDTLVSEDVNVPYLASFFFEPPIQGDPPSPGGSGFGVPRTVPQVQTGVPEPLTSSFSILAAAGMLSYLRRR